MRSLLLCFCFTTGLLGGPCLETARAGAAGSRSSSSSTSHSGKETAKERMGMGWGSAGVGAGLPVLGGGCLALDQQWLSLAF